MLRFSCEPAENSILPAKGKIAAVIIVAAAVLAAVAALGVGRPHSSDPVTDLPTIGRHPMTAEKQGRTPTLRHTPLLRLRPPSAAADQHERYQSELLPQVALTLGLRQATVSSLVELDRRWAAADDGLTRGAPAGEGSVAEARMELRNAYSRARVRILGGIGPANRYEEAMAAAHNGTLSVLSPSSPDPADPFTVSAGDFGAPGSGLRESNRYDSLFSDVR
jgi:hypothetical protein